MNNKIRLIWPISIIMIAILTSDLLASALGLSGYVFQPEGISISGSYISGYITFFVLSFSYLSLTFILSAKKK